MSEQTSSCRIPKGKDAFVIALLAGANVTQAAQEAGVCRQTGSRWFRDPDVIYELRSGRAQLFACAGNRLAYLHIKAVNILEKHMDGDNGRLSLEAAKTILQWGQANVRNFWPAAHATT